MKVPMLLERDKEKKLGIMRSFVSRLRCPVLIVAHSNSLKTTRVPIPHVSYDLPLSNAL